jgi:hypothetical protein
VRGHEISKHIDAELCHRAESCALDDLCQPVVELAWDLQRHITRAALMVSFPRHALRIVSCVCSARRFLEPLVEWRAKSKAVDGLVRIVRKANGPSDRLCVKVDEDKRGWRGPHDHVALRDGFQPP